MGGIIFQCLVIVFLVGLLIFVALDDRRNRVIRQQEDLDEQTAT